MVRLFVAAVLLFVLAGCRVSEICESEDGLLSSNLYIMSGDIWVDENSVDPYHTDLLIGDLARVGDIESQKLLQCERLIGNIEIRNDVLGFSDFSARTVPALSNLEVVEGDVSWIETSNRIGVEAFPSVRKVEGTVRIAGATSEHAGFDSMTEVGSIRAAGRFQGFGSVVEIQELLSVQTFDKLAFPLLERVGNVRVVSGREFVAPQLTAVEESFVLTGLTSDTPLSMPERVGQNISLQELGLRVLGERTPLEVGGGVFITNNSSLDSDDAIEWAESIPLIRGESQSAQDFGPIYVCNNSGTGGNCPGEDNAPEFP